MNYSDSGKQFLDILIENLSSSNTFNTASFWSKKLLPYSKFTKNQINAIADAFIHNSQIYGSFYAQPTIMQILRDNQKLIDPDLKKYLEF